MDSVWVRLSFVALFASGCGSHDFQGSSKSIDANPYAAINWLWQCSEEDYDPDLKNTDTQINLQGPGPHKLNKLKGDGAPLKISGNVCAGDSLPRDVVFIIDVSQSMRDVS